MDDYPGTLVVVSTGGTTRGIKAVIDGTADIGVTSSLINEELSKYAREKEVTLETHVVGRGAVVPIVHPSNPIDDISLVQLQRVFSGHITNWKFLGGSDAPIKLTSNEFTRGAFETWKRCVMGRELVVASSALVLSPEKLRKYISNNTDAIGYMSYSDTDCTVKPLSVDGIVANTETVYSTRFPIRRDHALVTRTNPPEMAKKFMTYFLDPQKGQKIVAKSGVSSIQPKAENK